MVQNAAARERTESFHLTSVGIKSLCINSPEIGVSVFLRSQA